MIKTKKQLKQVQALEFTHIDKIIFTSPKGQFENLINPNMRKILLSHPKAIKKHVYYIYKTGGEFSESCTCLGELLAKHIKVLYPATYQNQEMGLALEKVKTDFNNKRIQIYKKKGYVITTNSFWDKKFQNIKGGEIINELKNIKIILNDNGTGIKKQLNEAIKDCINKGYFLTEDIEEVYSKFNITEIELNSFFNNKQIFETLRKNSIFNYETTAYLWENKNSSELYSYNVSAKNENREVNKNNDLFKIEVRLKSGYLRDLKKKHPEIKPFNFDELCKWLLDFINNSKNKKDSLSQKTYNTMLQPFKEKYFDEWMYKRMNNKMKLSTI